MDFRVWCKNERKWEKDTIYIGGNGILVLMMRDLYWRYIM